MAKKTTEANYKVAIAESSRELTSRERIAFKDTADAIKLDEACDGKSITIKVTGYVVLDVHNEKSENVDYKVYILIGEDGTKYVTGSSNFFNSFLDIYSELDDDDVCEIKVFKKDSKNYTGKKFITCSLVV